MAQMAKMRSSSFARVCVQVVFLMMVIEASAEEEKPIGFLAVRNGATYKDIVESAAELSGVLHKETELQTSQTMAAVESHQAVTEKENGDAKTKLEEGENVKAAAEEENGNAKADPLVSNSTGLLKASNLQLSGPQSGVCHDFTYSIGELTIKWTRKMNVQKFCSLETTEITCDTRTGPEQYTISKALKGCMSALSSTDTDEETIQINCAPDHNFQQMSVFKGACEYNYEYINKFDNNQGLKVKLRRKTPLTGPSVCGHSDKALVCLTKQHLAKKRAEKHCELESIIQCGTIQLGMTKHCIDKLGARYKDEKKAANTIIRSCPEDWDRREKYEGGNRKRFAMTL